MSTRASVLFLESDDESTCVHLFEDVQEHVEESGLHLELDPVVSTSDTGQYGDFSMAVRADGKTVVCVRIPWSACEAIAKFVVEHHAFKRGEVAP